MNNSILAARKKPPYTRHPKKPAENKPTNDFGYGIKWTEAKEESTDTIKKQETKNGK